MKYRWTPAFDADYQRLSTEERHLFREAFRLMNDAYQRRGEAIVPHWPKRLRIKRIQGHDRIWEMTWSFAGPAGRATFEYFEPALGEVGIFWRRIGGHEILDTP